jgi:SulP family sulfate permease
MAYAMIAALPPIIGLYTASVAPFVYALLGTSQQLSVGPVSLVRSFHPP